MSLVRKNRAATSIFGIRKQSNSNSRKMENSLCRNIMRISKTQSELCDIAFGDKEAKLLRSNVIITKDPISTETLRGMAEMIKVEFDASLKKEINNPGDDSLGAGVYSPKPYDVSLIESDPWKKIIKNDLAICVPVKGSKIKKGTKRVKTMMWLDSNRKLWPLDSLRPIRPVGSLSGPSRTLDALDILDEYPQLMQAAMQRTFLYEIDQDLKASSKSNRANGTSALNESQRQAVALLTEPNFKLGFFIVQGPPGCGKTTTIVEMIHAAIESSKEKILVCAPSNAAVANIALKLDKAGQVERCNLLVFGENCDKSVHHLNPVHRSENLRLFLKEYENTIDDFSREKQLKRFSEWLQIAPEQSTIQEIRKACDPYVSDGDDGTQLLTYLSEARVVLCTLNSSGSTFLQRSVERELIFLDEAGQCPEGEHEFLFWSRLKKHL